MNRRRALRVLSGSAIACVAAIARPSAAAPPQRILKIGLLTLIDPFDPDGVPLHRALMEGLRARGYEAGRNFVVEARCAQGDQERLPALAAELARAKVDIFIAPNISSTLAAREATRTIPIVMLGVPDPVSSGIIASLSHPGGNITGLGVNGAEISAKRVQLLKEAVPTLARVAVLWNSSITAMSMGFHEIEKSSPKMGITVGSFRVTGSDGLDGAFRAIAQAHSQGLVVLFGPMRGDDLPRIVQFVTAQRIPAVFELGRGVDGGGLMEFGPNLVEMAKQVGGYVDKLANGAKAGELPVEEPTLFGLAINLKAARSMGLEVPASLVMRATRVVE